VKFDFGIQNTKIIYNVKLSFVFSYSIWLLCKCSNCFGNSFKCLYIKLKMCEWVICEVWLMIKGKWDVSFSCWVQLEEEETATLSFIDLIYSCIRNALRYCFIHSLHYARPIEESVCQTGSNLCKWYFNDISLNLLPRYCCYYAMQQMGLSRMVQCMYI